MLEFEKTSDDTFVITSGAIVLAEKEPKVLIAKPAEFDPQDNKIMVQTPAPIILRFTEAGLVLFQPPVYRSGPSGLNKEKPESLHTIVEIGPEHTYAVEWILCSHSLGHYKPVIEFSSRGLARYVSQEEAEERRGITERGVPSRKIRELSAAFG